MPCFITTKICLQLSGVSKCGHLKLHTQKIPLQGGRIQICSKVFPFPKLSSTEEVFQAVSGIYICSLHSQRDRKRRKGSEHFITILTTNPLYFTGHWSNSSLGHPVSGLPSFGQRALNFPIPFEGMYMAIWLSLATET